MADAPDHFDTGPGKLTITDHELFERLRWFTYVRWGFGLFCLLALLISWYGFGVRFRLGGRPATMAPVIYVILAVFLYNAIFTFLNAILVARRQITRPLIDLIAVAQILCDVVAITKLVRYTGGIENPFIMLSVVPLAIVAELLRQRLAYGVAVVAVVLLNGLAWAEQQGWIPHTHVELADGTIPQAAGLYADWRYVLAVMSALTAALFAMVFVATTIAARLRTREEQLEKAHDILRATDEAKSFLMRRAEHEMRAPLAAIHSLLESMALKDTTSPEQADVLARAQRRTTALMDLVKDLRRYSWFRRPDRIFQTERFPLDAVVSNTIDLFRPQAQQQELNLTASVVPVAMEGNEEMMRELATNLISNAVQYTPAGGQIDIRLDVDGEVATFSVADTGIGMTPEAKSRLFEEFYRAPEAKQTFKEGTGLGMAIVNRIIQIHRGQIDVRDTPGGGTTVRVRLPLQHTPDNVDL